MENKDKFLKIFLNVIPIILMILLIPVIANDYILTGIYLSIIGIAFSIKYEKKEYIFLIFGFIIMTISEAFFISTGAEVFTRKSFLDLMPI